jgi:hypothetical protein
MRSERRGNKCLKWLGIVVFVMTQKCTSTVQTVKLTKAILRCAFIVELPLVRDAANSIATVTVAAGLVIPMSFAPTVIIAQFGAVIAIYAIPAETMLTGTLEATIALIAKIARIVAPAVTEILTRRAVFILESLFFIPPSQRNSNVTLPNASLVWKSKLPRVKELLCMGLFARNGMIPL